MAVLDEASRTGSRGVRRIARAKASTAQPGRGGA
jgi:hypothetical protein